MSRRSLLSTDCSWPGSARPQLFAFLWTLVVRPDLLDRIDGYRIYGLVANVLFGLGWIVLGLSLAAKARSSTSRTLGNFERRSASNSM